MEHFYLIKKKFDRKRMFLGLRNFKVLYPLFLLIDVNFKTNHTSIVFFLFSIFIFLFYFLLLFFIVIFHDKIEDKAISKAKNIFKFLIFIFIFLKKIDVYFKLILKRIIEFDWECFQKNFSKNNFWKYLVKTILS